MRKGPFSPRLASFSTETSLSTSAWMPRLLHHLNNSELFHSAFFDGGRYYYDMTVLEPLSVTTAGALVAD
eukprot:1273619-Alexandrium_andersonii.AAC.1